MTPDPQTEAERLLDELDKSLESIFGLAGHGEIRGGKIAQLRALLAAPKCLTEEEFGKIAYKLVCGCCVDIERLAVEREEFELLLQKTAFSHDYFTSFYWDYQREQWYAAFYEVELTPHATQGTLLGECRADTAIEALRILQQMISSHKTNNRT